MGQILSKTVSIRSSAGTSQVPVLSSGLLIGKGRVEDIHTLNLNLTTSIVPPKWDLVPPHCIPQHPFSNVDPQWIHPPFPRQRLPGCSWVSLPPVVEHLPNT